MNKYLTEIEHLLYHIEEDIEQYYNEAITSEQKAEYESLRDLYGSLRNLYIKFTYKK